MIVNNEKKNVLFTLLLILVTNLILIFCFNLDYAVTDGDGDKDFYVKELPNLINNVQTTLAFPLLRTVQPSIAILLSNIASGISVEFAMKAVSFAAYLFLVLFFGVLYTKDKINKLQLFILVLFPIFIVYQTSYHVESLFYCLCLIYCFLWEKFAITNKTIYLVLCGVLGIIAILTKEAFFIFYCFGILYTLIFYKKRTVIYAVCLILVYIPAFYINYYWFFETKQSLLIQTLPDSVMSIRYGPFEKLPDLKSIVHIGFAFLMTFSSFGAYLFYLSYKNFTKKETLFLAFLVFCSIALMFKIGGFGSKYIFLIMGPFLFLLIGKIKKQCSNYYILIHYLGTVFAIALYSWIHSNHLKL
ncbi:MAG: hypothetical protein GX612_03475 [Bacteroidales bacterium]|nr:hypothetical protein [Bacteroidales bacterium]